MPAGTVAALDTYSAKAAKCPEMTSITQLPWYRKHSNASNHLCMQAVSVRHSIYKNAVRGSDGCMLRAQLRRCSQLSDTKTGGLGEVLQCTSGHDHKSHGVLRLSQHFPALPPPVGSTSVTSKAVASHTNADTPHLQCAHPTVWVVVYLKVA